MWDYFFDPNPNTWFSVIQIQYFYWFQYTHFNETGGDISLIFQQKLFHLHVCASLSWLRQRKSKENREKYLTTKTRITVYWTTPMGTINRSLGDVCFSINMPFIILKIDYVSILHCLGRDAHGLSGLQIRAGFNLLAVWLRIYSDLDSRTRIL